MLDGIVMVVGHQTQDLADGGVQVAVQWSQLIVEVRLSLSLKVRGCGAVHARDALLTKGGGELSEKEDKTEDGSRSRMMTGRIHKYTSTRKIRM